MEPALSVYRGFWRKPVSPVRLSAGSGVAALALSTLILSGSGLALAQGMSEQQIRCLQLQQELAAAQGGGGANREEVGYIDQQIAQADRVFQGTRASMEDAGCFESFFIFGRGLVRSPKCLNMNNRLEDARRQLAQLQQQRQALTGGGGNKRRQAELQQAMARSGCGGVPQPARRRGGLFDFFSGGREDVEELPQTPIYRSIDPNGRYRTVCVRLCDGFFYPVSYATYGARVAQDAERCQSTCAAPAELYVYRNPGQEIEQAVSLSGSAYMDLPVALRYRSEYVKGCSCKQAEYNPTEIEAANKRADAGPAAAQPAETTGATPAPEAAPPPPQEPPSQMAVPAGAPQFDLDVTGSNEPAPPPQAATETPPPAAVPEAQQAPAPPPAAEAPPPAPAPPPTAQVAPPPPAPPVEAPPPQSTVTKRKPAPVQPASPFAPQF
jgi:hypothetical protein